MTLDYVATADAALGDSPEEVAAAVAWLQNDAAHLYAKAAKYRDAGDHWFAGVLQATAAHSAQLARAGYAKVGAA